MYAQALLIFTVLFVCSPVSLSKTIRVPSDAASVKEAVEMAVSGDEIVLDEPEVDWVANTEKQIGNEYKGEGGIVLKNKNLTISGRSSGNRTRIKPALLYEADSIIPNPSLPQASLLWIEDATLVLRHLHSFSNNFTPTVSLYTSYPTRLEYFAAPIVALSGALVIEDSTLEFPIYTSSSLQVKNSHLACNTWVYGEPYWSHTTAAAGLRVADATEIEVVIQNSTVGNPATYKAMEFSRLTSSRILIHDSKVTGGRFSVSYRSEAFYSAHSGTSAIQIDQCFRTWLELDRSWIHGGQGFNADITHPNPVAASGGPGLLITDSSARVSGGYIVGGPGEKGGYYSPSPLASSSESILVQSGPGGCGIQLVRSQVEHQGTQYYGGPGGPSLFIREDYSLPPGPDGAPLYLDEFSIFQEITPIPEWSLY